MPRLDKQELEIVRQLIMNPRLSDNQIAKNTKVPLKSVNRKRKLLEQKGLLNYFCYLDTTKNGTGAFGGRDLYVIVFRHGITRKEFLDKYLGIEPNPLKQKHILAAGLCEYEGRLCLAAIITSRLETDIIEIFNAELLPELTRLFGAGAVDRTITMRVDTILQILHNYLPLQNMKNGIISKDWKQHNLFVDDTE